MSLLPEKLSAFSLAIILAGCQTSPGLTPVTTADFVQLPCDSAITAFRSEVNQAGVGNASSSPMPEFPLLHSNRYLVELAQSIANDSQLHAWIELAASAGKEIRAAENAALMPPWQATRLDDLHACALQLVYGDEPMRLALKVAARNPVPDNYSTLPQWLGLYPLLRPLFRQRILVQHAQEQAAYRANVPFSVSQEYAASETLDQPTLQQSRQWLQSARTQNALAVPQLPPAQLTALFARHAPNLQIEQQDSNDLIGTPQWRDDELRVNTTDSASYTLPSFTRFAGRNLLQLNYVFWFSARQPRSWLDLYAGKFDSIIWRVTLDDDGSVLLYDSIHSCGCYHKYFFTPDKLRARAPAISREPANLFVLDRLDTEQKIRLRIDSNTHYIVGVDNEAAQNPFTYELRPYSDLSTLDKDNSVRSFFDSDGLVPASSRLERFTLWPTGIHSVGAMRQWGVHATGFVERQHFDDATLFDNYLERVD